MDEWFPALLAGVLVFSSIIRHSYREALVVSLAFAAFFYWFNR